MVKQLTLGAALLIFYAAVSAQNYITLYEDCNYSGKKHYLETGSYRVYLMKIENDKLSSMQIPSGMKVTLYEHDEFKGKSKTFYANTACLDNEWNDITSSIVIENQNYQPGYGQTDYITFFKDCYSQGYSQSLRPGTYSGNQLGQLKFNISSFAIYGSLQVRVYLNNENASGYSSLFDANQPCLSSSYNDRIGSLVIEYKSSPVYNYPGTGSGNYATIYTDCSYRGNSLRLAPGSYQGDKLGLLRYDISSIELPSNLKARVYVNNEYLSGSYYTLTETSRCLSSTLNNRIGSLIIEENYGNNNNNNNYPPGNYERVVLYSDANYRGQSASLLPGTYPNMPQAGFLDKALSSLTVPVGYRVVLYEFENFKGKSYTITASKSMFIISVWNDKTSSIAVYRDR
ncbi:MAG: hypothetical protein IPO53_10185 [Chitinophagaceae bacterium]|nr:hypothetical protein [Chitinophagaceae bacterium]